MVDTNSLRERLTARRLELVDDLTRLTAPPEEGANVSFGKRIGEGTTEAVEHLATTATARSIAASIADIDRAVAKLDEGSYGLCDRCGAPIGEERLDYRPATSVCVACAD